jgi:TRAP-type mannitol/chloroaromatic compound transport system permease small subunit
MPRIVRWFVRGVDAMNHFIGRIAMYLIFALIGVLMWSSVSKVAFEPTLWTLEMAQFVMVAYYVIGGPYAIQMGSNVRMDLFYGSWSVRQKAWMDAFTVLFLMFYLGVLLYGAIGSTAYSLGHFEGEPFSFFWDLFRTFLTEGAAAAKEKMGFIERSPTAWRPYIWPVKLIMIVGVTLMLLQVTAEFFRDIGRIRGVEL